MNIIVIMLDSLRPDYLGCYGHKEVKSPTIDRIAQEGTLFTRAYAEFPITIPSRTAFLSGVYTHTNRPWEALHPEDPSLPELLQKSGYYTGAIGDAVLTWGNNLDRGFNDYHAFKFGKCCRPDDNTKKIDISHAYFPPTPSEYHEPDELIYRNTLLSQREGEEKFGKKSPEIVTDEALKWIEKHKNEKFFLWLDYFEIHEPWESPRKYTDLYGLDPEGKFIPMPPKNANSLTEKELHNVLVHYKASITQMDDEIARIESKLKELKLKEDTLLIITSDHGEPFGEHGIIRKYNISIYEELAPIVLIMRKPGLIPSKRESKTLALNLDVPATIAEMAGAPIPEKFEGSSLLPVIKGEKDSLRERIFTGVFQLRAGVVEPPYKFIDNRGEKENELFNIVEDPGEKTNLLSKESDIAGKLHRKVWEFGARWSRVVAWRDHPID